MSPFFVFRGFLMQTFGSWFRIPIIAIIIQALVFTSLHQYDIVGLTSILISGLLFGLIAWYTRGLEISTALHTANNLAAFLYKINFITARKQVGNEIMRVYYDENQYIYNDFTDFGYAYEIHPAYRWALQPTTVNDLFNQIELLSSE